MMIIIILILTIDYIYSYECINEHIQHQNDCPSCRSRLSRSDIYPNFQRKDKRIIVVIWITTYDNIFLLQVNRLADLKTQVLKEGISTFKIDHDPIQELVMNIRSDTSSIATSIANTLSFAGWYLSAFYTYSLINNRYHKSAWDYTRNKKKNGKWRNKD